MDEWMKYQFSHDWSNAIKLQKVFFWDALLLGLPQYQWYDI